MNPPARRDILQLQSLSFAYPGQPALFSDWSAAIGAGVTHVHGDTGSGKSTLMRVLAGVMPASGRLTLAGVQLNDNDDDAYRRHVFFCDTTTAAFDQHTPRECTAQLSAGDSGFDEARWQRLVSGFALAPHLDKSMHMLSTGSKRKVWLAAALASGRALVLLDAPTGGLDATSIGCLWRELTRCARQSERAVVVASAERIVNVPLAGSIELPFG